MSKVLLTESSLANIGNAIRGKNGQSTYYKPGEMPAAIEAIPTGITPTGTVNITQNGTTDVTRYANAEVNVPNSYAAGDEGKVVSNGELVAQTARPSEITQNGTYDTTLNDEVTVNVSGSSPTLITKNITQNGTYNASSDNVDGYSIVEVNVGSSVAGPVRIWTKSTSGTYAAVWVQKQTYDPATGTYTDDGEAVAYAYTDVQFSTYVQVCNGLVALSYGNPSTQWAVTALKDVTNGTTIYKAGSFIANWPYNSNVNIYLREVSA